MVATLVNRAELDQSTRSRGGLLANALPAPEGWERGLAVPFYGCGAPILQDQCVTATDEAHRPVVAEFPSFPIKQTSECSTLSGLAHDTHAVARLNATTEWAMGRQLSTDAVGLGSPSLADAILMLSTADPVDAVSQLEQGAADTGYGSRTFLHATPRAAAYLKDHGLIDDNGYSPAGHPWIISPGYAVDGEPGAARIWATGPVWAAVSTPDVYGATEMRINTTGSVALRSGVVVFDPCINIAVDIEVPAYSPPEPPEPPNYDPEALAAPGQITVGNLSANGVQFSGTGFPPDSPVTLVVGGEAGGTVTSDSSGTVSFPAFTSSTLGAGEHAATLTSGQWSAGTTITVFAEPSILLTPTQITVSDLGTSGVEIDGAGFPAGAVVTLTIAGNTIGTETATANGDVSFTYTTPSGVVGGNPVSLSSDFATPAGAVLDVIADPDPEPDPEDPDPEDPTP